MDHAPPDLRYDDFRAWLERVTDLSGRSVRDTVSRTRRVAKMIDILAPKSDHELNFRLQESGDYQACSASVRSQLKRAASSYRNFIIDSTPSRS